jgi:hypothetical protein
VNSPEAFARWMLPDIVETIRIEKMVRTKNFGLRI